MISIDQIRYFIEKKNQIPIIKCSNKKPNELEWMSLLFSPVHISAEHFQPTQVHFPLFKVSHNPTTHTMCVDPRWKATISLDSCLQICALTWVKQFQVFIGNPCGFSCIVLRIVNCLVHIKWIIDCRKRGGARYVNYRLSKERWFQIFAEWKESCSRICW